MAKTRGGVIPYLTLEGAMKAAEFYQRAFGAEIAAAQPTDDEGRTMHVHLYVNGGSLMLSDAYPEHGHAFQAPAGFNINLPVDDTDAWHQRAVDAGATSVAPPANMFWGDRYAQVRDPFGVLWAFNTSKQD
jgi:uncharacterized glyoxalase superfamily protein PhnB